MQIKPWLIALVFISLQACSSSRIEVNKSPNFQFQGLSTFKIEHLRIDRTYSNTDEVLAKATILEQELSEKMIAKGYSQINEGKPNFRIGLSLAAFSESSMASQDQNFMKGVHGSGFPLADPRARSYNSDVLSLEVKKERGNIPDMTAACLLNEENSPVGASTQRTEMSIAVVERCLSILLEGLPRYSF